MKDELANGSLPIRQPVTDLKASETQHRQTEETLSGEKEESRTMIEDSPLGVSLIGRDGDYRYINPKFTEIFGYTLKDIPTGREWFEKAYPDEEYRNQVISTWKSDLKKSSRGESRPRVFTVTCKDGSEKVIHFRAVTIETGGQFVIYEDITERTRAEGFLRKSEEKFRGLAERSFDAIYELDLNGSTTYVSPAVERITGYRPEELLGKSFWNHVPEGEMTKALQALTTLRTGRNLEGLQVEIVKKDGSLASVEINASPIMRNGEVIGCQGIFRDITQRKKAEEELEESRSHFESLFDLMVDPVVIVDGKGKILELSNGVQKVTGFKREELLGKNFLRTKVVTAKSKAILVKNLAKRMMGVKIPPYEIEILTKDGKKIPIEANAAKITYRGKPADMAVFRDIAERKKVEEALRESEEKFRNLSEQSPNMIFINKKGRVVYANERCEEAMGHKREEFCSPDFDFLTLIAPESKELIKSSFKRHMKAEEVAPYEYALITKDGKRIEVIITTKLINYEGERAILGIVTDITERKRGEKKLKEYADHLEEMVEQRTSKLKETLKDLEKEVGERKKAESLIGEQNERLKELDRMKSEFLSTAAHELRTPLTSIVGFSEILLERKLDEERRNRFLKIINEESKGLAKLINDLLDVSGIESGRGFKIKKAPTDVKNIILENVDLFQAQTDKHTFKVNIPPDPVKIELDKDKIDQVMENLLTNAVKFSPQGGKITVSLEKTDRLVRISVTDTGIGIPEKDLSHIFEKFYRIETSSTQAIGGTGLGLSITKYIVESHEGKISVESKVGKGSTFSFTLPNKKCQVKRREQGLIKKILIADDRCEVVELVKVALEGENYQILSSSDGREALEKIRKMKPDLILLDIIMPKMDGFEVLENLKNDSKTKDIPIIMLTAKGQKVDKQKGKDLGALDYIIKPFSPSHLLNKIEEILV